MAIKRKQYLYKVYKPDGEFVSNLNDVISEPNFDKKINASLGELTLRLARKFDSFGEEVDITLNYEIRITCVDFEAPNGIIVYSGYISGYKPVLNEDSEYVEITLLPFVTSLEDDILNNAGVTTVAYSSQDPNDILSDIISKYAGKITKQAGTDVGVVVSYSFNTTTYLQAIKKCRDLSAFGWYFYIDASNELVFKEVSETPDHILTIGKDILSIQPEKRIENVKNTVLFVGDGIFKKYERSGSISAYGRKVAIIQDNRVSVEATADIMATKLLDEQESPEIRTLLRVLDSNSDSKGYDIESFKPGDIIKIEGFGTDYPQSVFDTSIWDETSWDYSVSYATRNPMQIVSIKYSPDEVELELSSKPIPVQSRVEDIYRFMQQNINNDNPSEPTI